MDGLTLVLLDQAIFKMHGGLVPNLVQPSSTTSNMVAVKVTLFSNSSSRSSVCKNYKPISLDGMPQQLVIYAIDADDLWPTMGIPSNTPLEQRDFHMTQGRSTRIISI